MKCDTKNQRNTGLNIIGQIRVLIFNHQTPHGPSGVNEHGDTPRRAYSMASLDEAQNTLSSTTTHHQG